MKRYMLFGMDMYDAGGGVNDFIKDFDKLKEIKNFLELRRITKSYWNIIDIKTKKELHLGENIDNLIDIINCRDNSFELLKILTLINFNKDIKKILYYMCLENCKYKFGNIEDY